MSQNDGVENANPAGQNPEERLVHQWTAHLLTVLEGTLPVESGRAVLKQCALVHYRAAQMDAFVDQYRGDLPGFIDLLAEKWQWKVVYDPVEQVILADENKPYCVCPIVRLNDGAVSGILCHCSEGFAERMFSAVAGRPVEAQVVQSVLRGSPSCIYRIQILP